MEDVQEQANWRELTLTIEQIARAAVRWLPVLTLFCVLPYLLLNGLPDIALPGTFGGGVVAALKWTAIAVGVYAVSAILHEVIHVIAMIGVGGATPSSIRFGFRPRDGVLYVHTDRPMTARAYRIVLLSPAVLQGVLPLAYGSVADVGWMVLYGYVMLVSAIGDLAVFHLIRRLQGDAIVRDHPTGVGCLVRRTA